MALAKLFFMLTENSIIEIKPFEYTFCKVFIHYSVSIKQLIMIVISNYFCSKKRHSTYDKLVNVI